MYELMSSPMFEPLLETNVIGNANPRNAFTRNQAASAGIFTASFMYYSRPEKTGGGRQLPML
jgi:hypothetical protein